MTVSPARPWHGKPRLTIRQLAELPIWILRPPTTRPLNCVLIEGPDGLVLINTGISRQHGEALRETIAGLNAQPLSTIIYPHHPTISCHGTAGLIDPDDARAGNTVIVAARQPTSLNFRGVAPNLLIDRECVLHLSGVTMRLLPVGTGTVGGVNIYLPHQRVAVLADEPCMWRTKAGPFVRATNWFMRFPVEHLLGSHMFPLSGPEVHLVLDTYRKNGRRQDA